MQSKAVFGWFAQGIPNNCLDWAKLILFNSPTHWYWYILINGVIKRQFGLIVCEIHLVQIVKCSWRVWTSFSNAFAGVIIIACGPVKVKLRWAANMRCDLSTINIKQVHWLRSPACKGHAGEKNSEQSRAVGGSQQSRVILLSSPDSFILEVEKKISLTCGIVFKKKSDSHKYSSMVKEQRWHLPVSGFVLVFENRSGHGGYSWRSLVVCVKVFYSTTENRKKLVISVVTLKHLSKYGIIVFPFGIQIQENAVHIQTFHWSLHIDWYLFGERWRDIFNLLSWDKADSWNPIRLPEGDWTAWCIIWMQYSYLWTTLGHVSWHGGDSIETNFRREFLCSIFFSSTFSLQTFKLMSLKKQPLLRLSSVFFCFFWSGCQSGCRMS